jgi:hypothetical protein
MKVECIPLDSFVHGSTNYVRHKPANIEQNLATELEKAGLVRVKRQRIAPQVVNDHVTGKVQDDGAGQPSSASPAAPASPPPTQRQLKRGKPARKGGL